jgi:hypothetical protein
VLIAFALGATSDVWLIRNGLSNYGATLLDRLPVIWPVWIAAIFLCSFLLDLALRRSGNSRPLLIPLATLLGMIVTHTVLLIRDVIADPTSHNLWPFEYVFWALTVAAPAYLGSLLAFLVSNLWRRSKPG